MKLVALLVSISLVGCANVPRSQSMTYTGIPLEQLEQIKLGQGDCSQIDQRISYYEQQLVLHGTWGKNPEELSEPDRRYNSAGKILIWSLRIGCNNPNRYKS